jgi:AraC-like DNA-binding protein
LKTSITRYATPIPTTAKPRLAAGESVTAIALDFRYANPSAFTQMFKSITGMPPSAYATDSLSGSSAARSAILAPAHHG